jgi:hypothetical protein
VAGADPGRPRRRPPDRNGRGGRRAAAGGPCRRVDRQRRAAGHADEVVEPRPRPSSPIRCVSPPCCCSCGRWRRPAEPPRRCRRHVTAAAAGGRGRARRLTRPGRAPTRDRCGCRRRCGHAHPGRRRARPAADRPRHGGRLPARAARGRPPRHGRGARRDGQDQPRPRRGPGRRHRDRAAAGHVADPAAVPHALASFSSCRSRPATCSRRSWRSWPTGPCSS